MCSVAPPHYGKSAETVCRLRSLLAHTFLRFSFILVGGDFTDDSAEQSKRCQVPSLTLIWWLSGGLEALNNSFIARRCDRGLSLAADHT